jgi:2-(1,2-epoxy-1,2-dihydrophenyl)acetyl-CoA isomerase
MSYIQINFEKIENVARITLNRPEKKNALNTEIVSEIGDAVEEISRDPKIKALILTGKGETFSSGGDVEMLINDLCPRSSTEIREILKKFYGRGAIALRSLEIPVIGAINGPALGAGFDLSLHCDMRIASETASFGSIWVRISTIPALGGMFLLPRIIGLTRASEMMMTGDVIDAREAYRIGLVNKVVPAEKLQETALELAQRLAKGASAAIAIVKNGINRGLDGTLLGEIDYAIYMQGLCLKMEDCQEGILAFKEKRKPKFKGR